MVRRRTVLDVRLLAVLVGLSVAMLFGCHRSEDETTPAVAATPSATAIRPVVTRQPDGSYVLEAAGMKFLLPADKSVGSSPPDGDIISLARTFSWPNVSERPQGSGDINFIVLRVFIHTRSFSEGTPLRINTPASELFAESVANLEGPLTDERTGLNEYRTKTDHRPVVYAFADASLLRADASRPFLECGGGTQDPEARCRSSATLSPYVEYEYTFSSKWLGDWPAIDSAINKFIEQLVLKP